MAGSKALNLVTLAAVLAIAWYAGQEDPTVGIAVAIVGLALAYAKGLVAIPAAIGLAAAALYVEGTTVVFILAGIVIAYTWLSSDGPVVDDAWLP